MREYEIVFVTQAGSIDEARLLAERLWRKWYRWHKLGTFGDEFPTIVARLVRPSTVTEMEYQPDDAPRGHEQAGEAVRGGADGVEEGEGGD